MGTQSSRSERNTNQCRLYAPKALRTVDLTSWKLSESKSPGNQSGSDGLRSCSARGPVVMVLSPAVSGTVVPCMVHTSGSAGQAKMPRSISNLTQFVWGVRSSLVKCELEQTRDQVTDRKSREGWSFDGVFSKQTQRELNSDHDQELHQEGVCSDPRSAIHH